MGTPKLQKESDVTSERIPTNLRMLLILEVVSTSPTPLTATEINDKIGLPKQTVHRLCTTLEKEGYLLRAADGKRLQPSRRLMEIGVGLMQASRFHTARHQILERVASTIRETVNYVVPQDTGMHYLDRVETDWPFRIQLPVGSNVPFHCTASGKTFMASLSKSERRSFVRALKLESHTSQTLTDPDQLLKELEGIGSRGFALDNEEFVSGMVALAVPVNDPKGRYVSSLAVHGPAQRLSVDGLLEHKSMLQDSAARISDVLFA